MATLWHTIFGTQLARKTKAKLRNNVRKNRSWATFGFDVSMSSICGVGKLYDASLNKMRGPAIVIHRWNHGEHYFERLKDAACAQNFTMELVSELGGVSPDINCVFIAVEEPWPMGLVKRMESGWLKQQAEVSGAFLGGLVRCGFQNVYQVNVKTWRTIVTADTGQKQNKDFTKWTVKDWAIQALGLPDMPDLIRGKHGMVPRPETSRAKAVQPEDVYDAAGVMEWMYDNLPEGVKDAS